MFPFIGVDCEFTQVNHIRMCSGIYKLDLVNICMCI